MIATEVGAALDGERLDRVVSLLTGLSRARSAELISDGSVSLGDAVAATRAARVHSGQKVVVRWEGEEPVAGPVADPTVDVRVLYDDDDVIVVDKQAGLVVHPGAGTPGGTLVNGLLARYPEIAEVGQLGRPGIVHRLDRGTSGVLVVARSPAAYSALVAALATHDIERDYHALAWGRVAAAAGQIDAPIGRSSGDPTRMAVRHDGREARTGYRVERRYRHPAEVTLLSCSLETGRTHQVRVHLQAIAHPVVGDPRYGGNRSGIVFDRPWLHARHLGFRHPVTGEAMSFDSPLPEDLVALLDTLTPEDAP